MKSQGTTRPDHIFTDTEHLERKSVITQNWSWSQASTFQIQGSFSINKRTECLLLRRNSDEKLVERKTHSWSQTISLNFFIFFFFTLFTFFVRTFKCCSFSNFQLYDAVLSAMVTRWYLRCSPHETLFMLQLKVCVFYLFLPIFPTLSPWQQVFYSVSRCDYFFFFLKILL